MRGLIGLSDTMLNPSLKEKADQVIELYNYLAGKLDLYDPDRIIELVKAILIGDVKNPREFEHRNCYSDEINELLCTTD